jgi:hypothetical protein
LPLATEEVVPASPGPQETKSSSCCCCMQMGLEELWSRLEEPCSHARFSSFPVSRGLSTEGWWACSVEHQDATAATSAHCGNPALDATSRHHGQSGDLNLGPPVNPRHGRASSARLRAHCPRRGDEPRYCSIRANFAARVSQGGSYSACAWRMRCEIYLTTSSLATCSRQSVYDSEVLLWVIPSLKKGNRSALSTGACMSFGDASNGPDFDTDLSRNVNLIRLLALGKFDLALSQRLVQSSQLLAAHPRGRVPPGGSSAIFVVGSAVTFRIFERS